MSAVFGLSLDSISEETSSDTIEIWDSLKHLQLVLAIEEEFQIKFDESEITEILCFKDIVAHLKKKKAPS